MLKYYIDELWLWRVTTHKQYGKYISCTSLHSEGNESSIYVGLYFEVSVYVGIYFEDRANIIAGEFSVGYKPINKLWKPTALVTAPKNDSALS